MKKQFIILAAFVGMSFVVSAQTTENNKTSNHKPYSGMYLQGGVAFPMLDLGKTDPTNSSSGMAALGYHFELGYSRQVTNQFGYKLATYYFGNAYNTKKYQEYYQGTIGLSHTVTSNEGWSVGGFLVKPYFYFPLSDNITWEFYGSAGLSAYYTPKYTITQSGTIVVNGQLITSSTSYNWNRSKGLAFAYGLGTQINFKLFNSNLVLSGDFLTSPIKYEATGVDSNNNSLSELKQMKLGYFSINIGYIVYF
ncbi:MAG: hypothetical protein JXR65_08025 [Bacteroidales bacterium]|nr:hypothetical protein [Bacteroidales bacterium]